MIVSLKCGIYCSKCGSVLLGKQDRWGNLVIEPCTSGCKTKIEGSNGASFPDYMMGQIKAVVAENSECSGQ
jgi:hypothetical protein